MTTQPAASSERDFMMTEELATAQPRELTPEELDGVAGGATMTEYALLLVAVLILK